MNKFEDLQAFVKVAEAGGISRAAERLHMTKSAVSRRISELELRLGVQLLHRTTRRISLTETGQNFYQSALRILSDLEEAELAVSQQHGSLAGQLKVAAPLTFGLRHLGPAINDFLLLHPKIHLDLDLNDRQVNILEEGFDVVVRIAKLSDSSFIARRLAPIHFAVCASPSYLAKHGKPDTPTDLLQHQCLVYSNSASPELWHYRDQQNQSQHVKVKTVLKANNGDFLKDAAVNGEGIVCLPTFIVNDAIVQNQLQRILTDYDWPSSNAYAIYPPTRHLSQRVRTFVDFLAERFKGSPYWDTCLKHH